MLSQKFKDALGACSNTASNPYLVLLLGAIEEIEATPQDSVLQRYMKKLKDMVCLPSFALDGGQTNEFTQTLGEAHFYSMCKTRGIEIHRVPEADKKTPDFRVEYEGDDVFFEVKTLSVCSGEIGIKHTLESSLNSQIQIEKQIDSGSKLAFGELAVQPYSVKPDLVGNITAVIETLIEKVCNNFKEEQFGNPNTFLVLNLSMLPPTTSKNVALRPIYCYCDDYSSMPVTGDLWMMAFCKPGMLVHCIPEFEGKPCIEGYIKKEGILMECDAIAGILFMVHPWSLPSELWGLFRSSNLEFWNHKQTKLYEIVFALVGKHWNDDVDSNGWQLYGSEHD